MINALDLVLRIFFTGNTPGCRSGILWVVSNACLCSADSKTVRISTRNLLQHLIVVHEMSGS